MGDYGTQEFVRLLTEWYAAHGRHFPWRLDSDPYRVLVTEVMLQKTSASSVLGVYNQFFAEFPTAQDVCRTDPHRLRCVLKPLGLPGRAATIKEVCHAIVHDWGGVVTQDEDRLHLIRGLGPYTIGALLCHAFMRQVMPVDINVARVLSRCHKIPFKKEHRHIPKVILEFAGRLPIGNRAREVSYGLLDLGSLICRATNPKCTECPLIRCCAAHMDASTTL